MPKESSTVPAVLSSFAMAVKERRQRLGLTQEELAWRAGLHRTYITDIERAARNVSLQSVQKLATALEATIAELFSGPPSIPAKVSGRRPADPRECVDILLVEDNPDDVELTLEAFRAARLMNPVHTVDNGTDALDFLFRQGAFAGAWPRDRSLVVLLDLNLPRLSGLEVLRRLRGDARTRDLPVVVLTASGHGRDMADCRQLGCLHYLVKPVAFDSFCKLTPKLSLDWNLVGLP